MLWSAEAYYTILMHFLHFQGRQIDNRSTMAEKCGDVLFESGVIAVKSEVE